MKHIRQILSGLVFSLLVISCSGTLIQYRPGFPPIPPSYLYEEGASEAGQTGAYIVFSDGTHPLGGLHNLLEEDLSEGEKDEKTRANSLLPIDYSSGSAGGINLETEYEEADSILNALWSSGIRVGYKEGIVVMWREDVPRTPYVIVITKSYLGSLDFGPGIGKKKMGDTFESFFSPGVQDIQKDEKALRFVASLYKHFEDPDEENCLAEQLCEININPEGNYIMLRLPKMVLLFGNNERFQLVQIALTNDDHPGCFAMPLDLLSGGFFCGGESAGPVLQLGESYSSALEKSGINPDLSINYDNSGIFQLIKTGVILWTRDNFDEETEKIPSASRLNAVSLNTDYPMPLLVGNALVKVSVEEDDSVRLSLDPLSRNGSWSMEDIGRKIEQIRQSESGAFYLATRIPQIKGNHKLQESLITALIDLLESRFKASLWQSAVSITEAGEAISRSKIYKRVYGKHDDKYVLEPSGVLYMTRPVGKPLVVSIGINSATGDTKFQIALMDGDFERYILANQEPVLLNPEPQVLAGFHLGDSIYLRNKNIGEGSAVLLYPAKNGRVLTALAGYADEVEYPTVYEKGRDRDITWQKSEFVSAEGASFNIHPTGGTKEWEGRSFDEYKINGIALGSRFFGSLKGLCGIEDFSLEMGIYDREFVRILNRQISSAKSNAESESPLCPYIVPQDGLASGLNRAFFFPRHKLILSFSNRELYSVKVYQDPEMQ